MPKKVRVPTPLRELTHNEDLIEVNAATLGAFMAWQIGFGRARLSP
jgi:hypothetical protein